MKAIFSPAAIVIYVSCLTFDRMGTTLYRIRGDKPLYSLSCASRPQASTIAKCVSKHTLNTYMRTRSVVLFIRVSASQLLNSSFQRKDALSLVFNALRLEKSERSLRSLPMKVTYVSAST